MEDYTGLSALGWLLDPLDQPGPDFAFFLQLILNNPGPVLDVGCGAGRLLIPLVERGFYVEGTEPSASMRALCRQRCVERKVDPVVYDQPMQALDLPQTYRTIMIPCGTIHLLVERKELWEALGRLYRHLDPGGTLAITVYNPFTEQANQQADDWRFLFKARLPDGTEFAKYELLESWDRLEQVVRYKKRYEHYRDGERIDEQIVDAPERWYYKHEMVLTLEKAGFRDIIVTGKYSFAEAQDGDEVMNFIARK